METYTDNQKIALLKIMIIDDEDNRSDVEIAAIRAQLDSLSTKCMSSYPKSRLSLQRDNLSDIDQESERLDLI